MKKTLILLLFLLITLVAYADSTSDEALFNSILNSSNLKQKVSGQTQPTDRNLGGTQTQQSQYPQTQNQQDSLNNSQNNYNTQQNNQNQMQNTNQNGSPYPVSVTFPIYGHDIFNVSGTTQSQGQSYVADQNVNIPDDYTLGSGDSVTIQYWGRTSKTEELLIDRSGNVFSETLGKITLGGQSYGQARSTIAKMVKGMEGVSASLTISNTKTVKVLVSGSVARPGYYIINVFANVTQAIVNAGGVKDYADVRRVSIIRNGRAIDTIDYYSLINKGSYSPKIRKLMPDDVIFVPRTKRRVLVEGAVKNPAYYDLRHEATVRQVLDLAGGAASDAMLSNVVITRVNKSDMKLIIKSIDLVKGRNTRLNVLDGDDIKVYGVSGQKSNVITLSGNVMYPGEYEYRRGMRISDIVKSTGSLLSDTEMSASYIVRRDYKTSETKIVPFSLRTVLNNRNSSANLALQPYDNIVIVGKYQIMGNVSISVTGEVINPGDYLADKNASVYDMVVKAGGLTSSSDKKSIEIVNFNDDKYTSEYVDINTAMSIKAPLQGFIIVHGVYESALMDYVEISGDVLNSGEFTYFQGMTLNDLLLKAMSRDDRNKPYSIIVYRRSASDGDEAYGMDIKGMSDPKTNYRLKQSDRIIVKQKGMETSRYVNIEGAVFHAGSYAYAEHLTVKQLIDMAGGMKDSAYTENMEIVRKQIDSGDVVQKYFKVDFDSAGTTELMPNDRVVVRDISEYNKMEYVTLTGEVRFPGKYPIKKGEKLSSIIERAGGFTDYAYLPGADFTRVKVKIEKQQMLNKMVTNLERQLLVNANIQAMTASDATTVNSSELLLKSKDEFIKSLKNLKADGRVVIKLMYPRLLKGSVNDVELENGDVIDIPKMPNTIVISGSVLSPGAFVYNDKMSWQDYIKMTGGYLAQADKANVFIMKADGTAQKVTDNAVSWSPQNDRWEFSYFTKDIALQPGDTIVIPDNYNRIPWMRNIKDITQIMMQIAVTAGVLTNL